jgi:hypothetical protein
MDNTLRLVFSRSNGRNLVMSYPVANTDATPAMIKNLMDSFLFNASVFHSDNQPAGIVGAEFVSRSVSPVNL